MNGGKRFNMEMVRFYQCKHIGSDCYEADFAPQQLKEQKRLVGEMLFWIRANPYSRIRVKVPSSPTFKTGSYIENSERSIRELNIC